MSKLPALQRGLLEGEPNPTDYFSGPGDPTGRDCAVPRDQIAARLLAGTLPSDFDREKLHLFALVALNWLARDVRPRVVLSARHEVLWRNDSALKMLVAPQPLMLRRDRIILSEAVSAQTFEDYLKKLGSETSRYLLNDPEAQRGMLVSGFSFNPPALESAIFLEFTLRELPLDARSSGLASQFGLTRAESEIIDLVALMEAPKAIAERLGVSVNTVRTHIRRIYEKLGISTQGQLMRTIMAYCGG